jgi:Mycobacterium membrane protein
VFRLFEKPLLLVVVIALGAYAVVRIRDLFGTQTYAAVADGNGGDTKPFNPKHIMYEITGEPGGAGRCGLPG